MAKNRKSQNRHPSMTLLISHVQALRGKDYGKSKMSSPDHSETESGLQYKDLRVGDGPKPKVGETVVGDDKSFFKFRVGSQEVIPAFEEAITGMALGELGYLRMNDYNKSAPKADNIFGTTSLGFHAAEPGVDRQDSSVRY